MFSITSFGWCFIHNDDFQYAPKKTLHVHATQSIDLLARMFADYAVCFVLFKSSLTLSLLSVLRLEHVVVVVIADDTNRYSIENSLIYSSRNSGFFRCVVEFIRYIQAWFGSRSGIFRQKILPSPTTVATKMPRAPPANFSMVRKNTKSGGKTMQGKIP